MPEAAPSSPRFAAALLRRIGWDVDLFERSPAGNHPLNFAISASETSKLA